MFLPQDFVACVVRSRPMLDRCTGECMISIRKYQRTYATGNLNQNCNTIQILILVDITRCTKNLCIKNLQIVPESLFQKCNTIQILILVGFKRCMKDLCISESIPF